MIDEEDRFWTPDGSIFPGGPSTWRVLDWEQRRTIFVTMPDEQDEDVAAIQNLSKHIDTLDPNVRSVDFSLDGTLLSTSTELPPLIGENTKIWYPIFSRASIPEGVKTVLWSDLTELDRLGPNVDMVSYKDTTAVNGIGQREVAVKYYFLSQFIQRIWAEMNIVMRLPPHPNIMPLDSLVLESPQGRIVGFTTPYIHGGNLDTDNSRVFKLKWLRQLTQAVDDLNLKYGIMHQDIAARNLLVNSTTDDVVLFDFNFSIRVGYFPEPEARHDVKGVIFTLYEIITRDEHFRKVRSQEQDPEDVQQMDEWVKHPQVLLDHPVSEYRSVLNDWVSRRRHGKQVNYYTEAPDHIDWPNITQGRNGWSIGHADCGYEEPAIINWARPIRNKSSPKAVDHSQTIQDAPQPAAVDHSKHPETAALGNEPGSNPHSDDDKPVTIERTRSTSNKASAADVDRPRTFQEAQKPAAVSEADGRPEAAATSDAQVDHAVSNGDKPMTSDYTPLTDHTPRVTGVDHSQAPHHGPEAATNHDVDPDPPEAATKHEVSPGSPETSTSPRMITMKRARTSDEQDPPRKKPALETSAGSHLD